MTILAKMWHNYTVWIIQNKTGKLTGDWTHPSSEIFTGASIQRTWCFVYALFYFFSSTHYETFRRATLHMQRILWLWSWNLNLHIVRKHREATTPMQRMWCIICRIWIKGKLCWNTLGSDHTSVRNKCFLCMIWIFEETHDKTYTWTAS